MIDYSPLWETMKEKNVSTYALILYPKYRGFQEGRAVIYTLLIEGE